MTMTIKTVVDLIITYRRCNNGKQPERGFISHVDYSNLMNDRDIYQYMNPYTGLPHDDFDFEFMGIPFFVCLHSSTPLTLAGDPKLNVEVNE